MSTGDMRKFDWKFQFQFQENFMFDSKSTFIGLFAYIDSDSDRIHSTGCCWWRINCLRLKNFYHIFSIMCLLKLKMEIVNLANWEII